MKKLNLTEQQGEQIAALREEGLALRLEVEALRIAWEEAEQREKAVEQAAIMEKIFTYADDYEDENGNRKGERITDPADAWSMGEEVFMREYLPIVQSKWRELYGLEYPLNHSRNTAAPIWTRKRNTAKSPCVFCVSSDATKKRTRWKKP